MTHKDIYVKFMIEYDKANITSSYPSLTKYEIATILDKAYLALIAQKITGNNQRKVGFEADVKAIEDLRPLIVNKTIDKSSTDYSYSNNDYVYSIPDDLLYYVSAKFIRSKKGKYTSLDGKPHFIENVRLIDHNYADRYMATDTNMPWVPIPVLFMENQQAHVLVDSYKLKQDLDDKLRLIYIRKPHKFIDSVVETIIDEDGNVVTPDSPQPDRPSNDNVTHSIDNISGPITVVNGAQYTTKSYNSNGLAETIIWSIVEGSQYATITQTGYVTVLKGANNNKVVIRATNSADPTKYVEYTIYVTYKESVVYNIGPINGPDKIDNESNSATYTCSSNGTIMWAISGDNYNCATINGGKVTLKPSANNITITIRAYLIEDPTKEVHKDILCVYNSIPEETDQWFILDSTLLNSGTPLYDVEESKSKPFTLNDSILNETDILN